MNLTQRMTDRARIEAQLSHLNQTIRNVFFEYSSFLEESFRLLTLAIVREAFKNRRHVSLYDRRLGEADISTNVKIRAKEYSSGKEAAMLYHVAQKIIEQGLRIRAITVYEEETPDGYSFTFELFIHKYCEVVPSALGERLTTETEMASSSAGEDPFNLNGWKRRMDF